LFGEFPALTLHGRKLVPGTLYATLPRAEAFRRAAEAHPGLRAPPPEGGVLRECLRRHGVVPAWADLPVLVPDLVPTFATAEMIKDGELAALAALKGEFPHASYRVRGRPGRPGMLVWDPTRIADPAATLSRLLAVAVTLVKRDPPPSETEPRDIMDPRSWTLPTTDEPPEPASLAPATSAPAPRPGLILDDGGPPPAFRFRGQGPPSVLTVTSIFAIGRRVMVEVLVPPSASSTVMELAA
jgi:hypothetical protein